MKNDGRPYYGDEQQLPLLWFLVVPETIIAACVAVGTIVLLVWRLI